MFNDRTAVVVDGTRDAAAPAPFLIEEGVPALLCFFRVDVGVACLLPIASLSVRMGELISLAQ